jgi:hypothetical protein
LFSLKKRDGGSGFNKGDLSMGRIEQSIIIDAPVQEVWQTIRDFHDMAWAPNAISKCSAVGDITGDHVGAKRVLNDVFHETLIELNEAKRSFRYTIDDGPSPLSRGEVEGYVGVVRVNDASDGSTHVEWTSSWEGKEKEVAEFCHPIYVALLEDLKKTLS